MEKAFHRACFGGDLSAVEKMLSNGGGPALAASKDKHGATGLQQAAYAGHVDIVRVLGAMAGTLEATDAENCTALHNAVFRGQEACVDALIALKANVNHPDNDKSTPLHKAAFAGFSRVLGKLLEAGADASTVDVDGASALHKAAFNNHRDCVEQLLARDASLLDLTDRFGSTPLHKAAYNGAGDTLRVLLAQGASVSISDAHGLTPLHLAAYRGQVEAVAVLLGSSKCPIDMQTGTTQETALHCAARKGQAPCVQRLVDGGANVALRNASGLTALQLAEQQSCAPVVAILREAAGESGAAPDATAPVSGAMEPVTNVNNANHGAERPEKGKDEAGAPAPAEDNFDGDGGPAPEVKLSFGARDRWGFLVASDGERSAHSAAPLTKSEAAHKAKEVEREAKWLEMKANWDRWSTKKRKKLRLRCLKGIPDSMRPWAWPALAEISVPRAKNPPDTFQSLLARTEKTAVLEIIHRDLHRTFPDHMQFREKAGKSSLLRVLKAYSFYNPDIGYCLSTDHEVLTNEGFMGLDQYRARVWDATKAPLMVASLSASGHLVYEQPLALVLNPPRAHQPMVQVVAEDGVELLVTPEHDLYCLRGERNASGSARWDASDGYRKERAESWLSGTAGQLRRVQTNAAAGVSLGHSRAAGSAPLWAAGFGLRGQAALDALLELYGCWLGSDGGWSAVAPRWLEDRLRLVGLRYEKGEDGRELVVTDSCWSQLLGAGAGAGAAEAEQELAVAPWVWSLEPRELRVMLGALKLTAARKELPPDTLHVTTSVTLREQLLRMALHAGYSARFEEFEARGWRVWCREGPVEVDLQRDVCEVDYSGATWCVTVPSGLLWVRRARRAAVAGCDGETCDVVVHASTPSVVGNCQGMGFVAAMFLMYTVTEEEAFWMLVQMVDKYRMGGLWDQALTDVGKMCRVHSQLLGALVPKVASHLAASDISGALYAPSFYITGFAYSLPWPCVLRVWDAFLVDGMPVLHAVGVALLSMNADIILKLGFDELMPFLRFSHTVGDNKKLSVQAVPVSHVKLGEELVAWLPKVAKLSPKFEAQYDADAKFPPPDNKKKPK